MLGSYHYPDQACLAIARQLDLLRPTTASTTVAAAGVPHRARRHVMDGQEAPYVSSAETHSGAVVFLGDYAYKLKKPVDLGFLDFRSQEARLAACHREVELNRRLAPDVYLGVVDVHGPDGDACEHAVLMRRMPVDRSFAALIGADAEVDDTVREIARLVAGYHAFADRSDEISTQGSRDAVRERWLGNAREMSGFGSEPGAPRCGHVE